MAFTSHELAAAGPSGQQEDGQYSSPSFGDSSPRWAPTGRTRARLRGGQHRAAQGHLRAGSDAHVSSPSGSVDSNSRAELKTVKVDREKGARTRGSGWPRSPTKSRRVAATARSRMAATPGPDRVRG